jgi:succinyl-diaminopimelate desuccinylase
VTATETELATRLARLTLELMNVPSVSRDEAALLRLVAERCARLKSFETAVVQGDGLLARQKERTGKPWVVLAGHLDTVPVQDNMPGRLDGDVIHGLGSSDMKSALAVMLELGEWVDQAKPALGVDLGLLFFAREELPITESAVPALFQRCPELRDASLLVVMEPTDNTLQIGCLGNLNAEVQFHGKSAHSARPWQGENALHKALAGLREISTQEPLAARIGGLTYTEVVSVTKLQAGIAGNVIPDLATATINYRYAPDRRPDEAEARLRGWLPADTDLRVIGNAPPARVAMDNPLVERLRTLGNLPVEPKQAWTPVAEFSAEGLDAINFGPGAGRYAHQRDEQVEVSQIVRAYDILRRFLLAD